MSDARIAQTSDLHLAAAWRAAGLVLIEASAVQDPHRVSFTFTDPNGREPQLTREFFADVRVQAILQARRQLARAVHIAKSSDARRCSGDELHALVSAQQQRTYERVAAFAGNGGRR